MSIEANSQTREANTTTALETTRYDGPQFRPHEPTAATEIMQRLGSADNWFHLGLNESHVCVLNSPASLSNWSGTKHQPDNAQAEDQLTQRASSILPQLVPQAARQALLADLNILAEFVVYGASSFPVSLVNALRDLWEVTDEASEEGFPPPSEVALQNAGRLLREMYEISPRRFEVYPTPDGEIAIDAPDGYGRSVLLLCDSEGGAVCLVNMNGNHRRARYSTTETLPDGFVREALADLERRDD